MYNRPEQKQEVKGLIRGHQRFFFILFLPFLLIEIISSIVNSQSRFNDIFSTDKAIQVNNIDVLINSASTIVFSILASIFLLGAIYTVFNVLRGQDDFQNPLRKSLTFIDDQRLFWGTTWTWILRSILLSLWSLLFIPGFLFMLLLPNALGLSLSIAEFIAVTVWVVIKSLAYTQALWVYRDARLANQPVSAYTAIMTSQDMMKGYKVDYLVLQLSFIGWMILVAITSGIVGIYVFPYYYITQVKFYEFVKEQFKQKQTVLDVE
ncbi:hypothetical protein AKUA1202_00610 [Apilactobacillus kunkeei]|uniref:Integral membrane protein n=1 Tax=Apilactobacillus kunkeei TaxID=148814 RepID=A0AAC8WBD9_9LACO|nr:DUF975 family protein [Apilactobacillus kunkeei]ALJ31163.1 hypothetical protein APS55_02485 [Apilactobacillus kunkeei]KFJ15787.1 hypothetical protein JI66_00610 [Apilactobacillus kunkeei]MBX8454951.1 DUF975 family protein [Apilactobacillus kunkeei]MCT6848597.1 DUF975 family protein [Apilactobacillus kunkeei]QYU54495.1 DUF975 family protein [Apilactobacillus kunkeei]